MIGRRQLVLVNTGQKEKQHHVFRATRIHVWKICEIIAKQGPKLFQFEYLVEKDSFRWITLSTDHAILISMLIHSMGAEILHERNNLKGDRRVQRKSCGLHSNALVTTDNHSDKSTATVEAEIYDTKSGNGDMLPTCNVVNHKSLIEVVRTGIVALVSNDKSDIPDESDPLGVRQHSDVFTTITDTLPIKEDVSIVLTDNDL
ncbi:hypothetical protein KIN20_005589 [Parelaphostrongylus tenuis]|uniref:Sorting nexin-17/31 FERM domain-containing protein n=1 Tax=Parelaphostrongylus tenuis TaxID=148309 RepID=A0AAD5MJ47_PARTN|nr:hypothetical protein KIN20_005589 [Parelaphostrongylus tenuis]